MPDLDRRSLIAGFAATTASGLAGCVASPPPSSPVTALSSPHPGAGLNGQYATMYAPVTGDPFPIPAVDLSQMNPAFLRREVDYRTDEPPGTIIVDPGAHYLYFVQPGGRATRYGVGVGREGFGWSGEATVKFKREWPDWYPPKEMLERQPELMPMMTQLQSGIGMAGGPRNPMGCRSLYLWQGNRDTLYRIHGTPVPYTVGRSSSSGCIRMINQDAIHLYNRTFIGARVVVRPARNVGVV